VTSRADRLRKVSPGADEADIAALASLGQAEVAVITRVASQAGRDALSRQAERKRQRKADNRRHGNYDEADFIRRNEAVVTKQGERAASGNLDALAALGTLHRHVGTWIRWAVEGCRAEGYSDTDIGEAIGITRQSVGERFGRKGTLTADDRPEHAGLDGR
jgi:hypothetical protein